MTEAIETVCLPSFEVLMRGVAVYSHHALSFQPIAEKQAINMIYTPEAGS